MQIVCLVRFFLWNQGVNKLFGKSGATNLYHGVTLGPPTEVFSRMCSHVSSHRAFHSLILFDIKCGIMSVYGRGRFIMF
jgi:hypothetical protein